MERVTLGYSFNKAQCNIINCMIIIVCIAIVIIDNFVTWYTCEWRWRARAGARDVQSGVLFVLIVLLQIVAVQKAIVLFAVICFFAENLSLVL